jgi:hypothetical protein
MMRAFTFLRLTAEMTSPAYQGVWMRFIQHMQTNGRDPQPRPQPHLGLRSYASAPALFPHPPTSPPAMAIPEGGVPHAHSEGGLPVTGV